MGETKIEPIVYAQGVAEMTGNYLYDSGNTYEKCDIEYATHLWMNSQPLRCFVSGPLTNITVRFDCIPYAISGDDVYALNFTPVRIIDAPAGGVVMGNNPNVREFDCSGVKVKFEIDEYGSMYLTSESGDSEVIFWDEAKEHKELIARMFPNGYTKLPPTTEQATEIVREVC